MRLHYICTELKLGTKLIQSLPLLQLGQGRSYYKGGGVLHRISFLLETILLSQFLGLMQCPCPCGPFGLCSLEKVAGWGWG